jgi:Ca2+-transporting ATPase
MNNNHHAKTVEEVFRLLSSNFQGLTSEEAAKRQEQFGLNKLPEAKKRSIILLFIKQFHSVLIYVLFGAAGISFLIGKLTDTYVILAVVLANAVIGFFHEWRAEKAIEALKKMIVAQAKVYRNGELLKIPAEELVPGDVLFLEEGDKVPADARIIETKSLLIDESLLTGESYPVDKEETVLPKTTGIPERRNTVWMGTAIARGEARAVITATGSQTVIGQIAVSLVEVKRGRTHFELKSRGLVLQMGIIALTGAGLIFVIGFFIRRLELAEIFLFSVASLVASIPEGLPAVLTIVLAIGANRMARRNAMIRRLPAVETLGVATVIATDKTGTLTQNSMTVRKIRLPGDEEIEVSGKGWEAKGSFFNKGEVVRPLEHRSLGKLLHIIAVCNSGRVIKAKNEERFEIIGDPTEAALAVAAEKAGLEKEKVFGEDKKLDELPFDEHKKYRAALVRHEKHNEIYIVGAFEEILKQSAEALMPNGKRRELSRELRDKILYDAEDLARQAMRVVAAGYREVPTGTKEISLDLIKDLTFAGVIAMVDPPRPEVKEAIIKARRAGVRVIMKTGDHKETALAIAKEIGLVDLSVDSSSVVLTEDNLLKMSAEKFEKAVEKVDIFARVTPAMKMKIIETLQNQGEIVAMTGDGVNDALALKKADIGVAMGVMGTDVARESSEMVLADDNFASIVNAIEEGRVVFNNVRRTSFFLITTNVAGDVTIISTLVLGLPLPLLPIHALWLNLVTDGTMGTTLAFEPSHGHEIEEKPRKKKEPIINKEVVPFLIINVVLMATATIFFFSQELNSGIDKARTVAFSLMVFFQLFNVFNMRSIRQSIFNIGFFSNYYVIFGFLASVILQVAVLYIPFFRQAFQFVPLNFREWLIVILISSSVLWFGEIYKAIRKKINPSFVVGRAASNGVKLRR